MGKTGKDETSCCHDPQIWVAAEVHIGTCFARLERCATCEDHLVTCWWDPPPRGWVGAMGRRAHEVRERAVRAAFGIDVETEAWSG